MIQEIKLKNFLSFKDETTLSFEASNDSLGEESQIVQMKDGTRLLRFAIVYGYNASGKSNLIQLIEFFRFFWNSKPSNPEQGTPVVPFKLSQKCLTEHSFFEIVFYVENVKYWYQLELDQHKVYLEKLSYYKTTQPIMLFERKLDNDKTKIKFNANAVKVSSTAGELIELNCLKNISAFVARNQVNVDIPLIDVAKNWLMSKVFQTITPRVDLTDYARSRSVEIPELKTHLQSFLNRADFNISDMETKTHKRPITEAMMRSILMDNTIPNDVKKQLALGGIIENQQMIFTHSVLNGRKKEFYPMDERDESIGTLRTLGLETALYETIKKEGFLAVDEIETSLHAKLLEAILFEYLKEPCESQMIVSTHNDGLLDLIDDLIRKDSVWFVEKQKNGVSDLYKLTDFRGLNRLSSIRAAYRNKRFGATQFSV